MEQRCTYNRTVDRCPVVPDQAIRLGKSVELGKVPSTVGFDSMHFNGIDNPSDIIGRPSDNFEAMQMQADVLDAGRQAASAAKESGGAPAPAPATSQE